MKENREKRVSIYLKEKDYEAYIKGYKASTHRSISTYGSKLLLGKPVTTITRNRSVDDLIEIAVKLLRQLKALQGKDTFTASEKESLRKDISFLKENLIKLVDLCSQK
jgi:hypothetical protein